MKKSGKKLAAFCMAAVMAAGMLSGCGGGDTASKAEATTAAGAETANYDEALPKDYKGTLTMWGWDDKYYKTMTEAFQKIYPNVTFEYTPVANGDLLQKYQTALATGTELPDIGWSIIDSRAKVYELDMWEPLNQAPYNLDINEIYDYLHPIMVNTKGDVCGIEQCLSPAGMAYRRDLVKEYFGTDDRKELEAMFPTWDSMVEKGKEVYEKSGGKVHLFQSAADVQQFVEGQDATARFDGTTVNATAALKKSLEVACLFRDNDVTDKLEAWSPAWYASFSSDNYVFAGCATWSVPFTIEANDPNGEATGHWGLMNAPEGNISWGGTTIGITKTCKDKRLAWEFVRFATLSTEGAEALNTIGFLTSAKKPYEDKPELKSYKSKWFGDQDLGKMYLEEIIPNIQIRPMNVDDNIIHDALVLVTASLNNDKSMTAETAMKQLKEEISNKLPDATVE